VAVCDSHAEDFAEIGLDPVIVVTNAPDTAQSVEEMPATDAPLRVAVAGTIMPNRGYEQLIEATSIASMDRHPVLLNIAGPSSPAYVSDLAALAHRLGAEDLVHFRGVIPREEVSDFYAANHVVAAVYGVGDRSNDSLPNKLFEGMAAGRPVLVNQPEASQIVARYRCGWSLPSLDPAAIAQWMSDVASDPSSLTELGANGRMAYEQVFNWPNQVAKLKAALGWDSRAR